MISENKLKHMLGVARECRNLATQKGLSEDLCDAMFIMGFLHDIGYEYKEDSEHSSESVKLIHDFVRYLDECCWSISEHGKSVDNWTVFDEVLNTADMTISYTGSKTTVEERLKGIKERWGSDSDHYRKACLVADKLKEMGVV